jgi:hypothetical protein
MGHSGMGPPAGTVGHLRENASRELREGTVMNALKSQAFRVLLALSALASSALVLEAGKRWNF